MNLERIFEGIFREANKKAIGFRDENRDESEVEISDDLQDNRSAEHYECAMQWALKVLKDNGKVDNYDMRYNVSEIFNRCMKLDKSDIKKLYYEYGSKSFEHIKEDEIFDRIMDLIESNIRKLSMNQRLEIAATIIQGTKWGVRQTS